MLHSFLSSMSGGGSSDASKSYDGEASNYSSLPAASASNNNHIYFVSTTVGNHQAGFYKSNGSSWVYVGHDHDSLDDIAEGSTNKHFTDTHKTKLDGIEAGAEVNVQSDFNQSDTNADDFIKNKPTTNQLIDWTAQNQGSIDVSNLPSISLTTVQTAANESAQLSLTTQEGDVVVRSDEKKTYIRNSGSAGTMADFTLLETPTDAVTSVNGQTGAVTVGNVTIQATDPTSSSAFASSKIILNNTNGRLFWLKNDSSRIYYSTNDSYIDLTFSVASFSDNITGSTHLIGSGNWKGIGEVSFSISFNNASASVPSNTIVYETSANPDLAVTANTGTSTSFSNTVAVPYPAVAGTVRFQIISDGESLNESTTHYFYNNIHFGASSATSLSSEADIEGLDSNLLTNDHTRTLTYSGVSNEYIYVSVPSRLTDYNASGWKYNGHLMAFTKQSGTINVTNANGYTEAYETYRSDVLVTGNHSLVTSTSAHSGALKVYYGKCNKNSSFNEADIEGLDNGVLTSDATQTWNAVTTTSTHQYWAIALPTNLTSSGSLSFTDTGTGFAVGMSASSPETVSVTNIYGISQNYYVYATNQQLGASTTITVRSS